MDIIYLESARDDLVWFRHYYEAVFPEGSENAKRHFYAIEQALLAHPFIGHKVRADVYELPVKKTPFTFVYRVKEHRIEVLRVWDDRQG